MSKWYLIHNGAKIPYWLGLLIGLDQFLGCFVPGHDIDKTISHRLGVKRYKLALRKNVFAPHAVMHTNGHWKSWNTLPSSVQELIRQTKIPKRYALQWWIDTMLERIDKDHSPKSVNY